MAKIARLSGNLTPFAQTAISDDRKVFGGTLESDILDDNLTAEHQEGWQATTSPTLFPKLRDFNAAMFTAHQLVAYIMQQGVAEYDSGQTYYEHGMCSSGGKIFVSQVDDNTGELLTDPLFWRDLHEFDDLSVSTQHLVEHAVLLNKLLEAPSDKIIGFGPTNQAILIGAPLGINQTWINQTQDAEADETYTNITGRSISVNITGYTDGDVASVSVEGSIIGYIGTRHNNTYRSNVSFIVPPTSTYILNSESSTNLTITKWEELTM